MRCGIGRREIVEWFRDYVRIQSLAVRLIHLQIGCSLIGSLGALYNAVLLSNLCISLFALVAIESSSQTLARTYAVLLFFSLFIDVAWFFLFSHHIWHISSDTYGAYVIFSAKLTLAMQIIGFAVKFLSSFLWIQMYRLGVSYSDNLIPRDTDVDFRNSFLNPATPLFRRPSSADEFIGGSIYNPASYSPLSEDGRSDPYMPGVSQNHCVSVIDSTSTAETSHLGSPSGRTCRSKDDENAMGKLQLV